MQCLSVAELLADDGWTWEIKFDGYRCLACKTGKRVVLLSRNGKSFNDRFPLVVNALQEVPGDFTLDGEIVALDEQGKPSFQLLQNSRANKLAVQFYAFDLLHKGKRSLLALPLERRRELLFEVMGEPDEPLKLSPLLKTTGDHALQAVRELGLEGVVGKRRGSAYEAGERSGAWIKKRCNLEQEFVVGGYVPGTTGFESLILGYYEGRKLLYCARVKAGFVPRLRAQIMPPLKGRVTAQCPFANLPEEKASRWGGVPDSGEDEGMPLGQA